MSSLGEYPGVLIFYLKGWAAGLKRSRSSEQLRSEYGHVETNVQDVHRKQGRQRGMDTSLQWVSITCKRGLLPTPQANNLVANATKPLKRPTRTPNFGTELYSSMYKKQSTRAWIELAIALKLHLGQSNASKIAVVEAVMAHYNKNFGVKPTSTKTVETLATTSTSTGKNGFIEVILTQFVHQLHKHGVVPAKKFPTKKLLRPRIVASIHTALLVRILSLLLLSLASLSWFSLLLLSLASFSPCSTCLYLSTLLLSIYVCLPTSFFPSLSSLYLSLSIVDTCGTVPRHEPH